VVHCVISGPQVKSATSTHTQGVLAARECTICAVHDMSCFYSCHVFNLCNKTHFSTPPCLCPWRSPEQSSSGTGRTSGWHKLDYIGTTDGTLHGKKTHGHLPAPALLSWLPVASRSHGGSVQTFLNLNDYQLQSIARSLNNMVTKYVSQHL